MSDTLPNLHRKIERARELRSVVSTMKGLAAASISQFEKSTRALDDYYRAVQLGLSVCLRASRRDTSKGSALSIVEPRVKQNIELTAAVVFGSDQGLVGQFNEAIAQYSAQELAALPGRKKIWVVGERAQDHLLGADLSLAGFFTVPLSVQAITPLVGQILIEILAGGETHRRTAGQQGSQQESQRESVQQLYLFYNSRRSGAVYEPVSQRLLPLDETWRRSMARIPWPTRKLPEVLGSSTTTLQALIREYLFVSLFRACAESLASENASRLAAMERAERNIDQLREDLQKTFYRLRQSKIDEELFDVIAGVEALTGAQQPKHRAD
ncbi:F0F1 ATP synthase subunit gamma [Nitrosovibrio tenuis]|uniref:F-type H+-transporting ATPase subunit gamma n=1 Tax=Nitrosovibrio tenuis TaxID=1233 RepID=A0A1H7NHX4_9PROT|nr:F0F1 ATP synthase subunit gamma [Nitrosovibrio tenuis]SEL23162.1 F-type H+-transporting ATPase subunit gamma [Nitrosovibrio tenuis]